MYMYCIYIGGLMRYIYIYVYCICTYIGGLMDCIYTYTYIESIGYQIND